MKFRKLFKTSTVFFPVIAVAAGMVIHVGMVGAQTGAPKRENLLNGLKVLMWSDPKADSVSVRIRVHSGSAFDPQGKEGVMRLLADSLFPNQAARDFFTEDLDGSLDIVSNYDFIEVRASSRPEHFLTMLETVATAVASPEINKEITAQVRSALLKHLEEVESEPAYFADTAVAQRLFGTFPYGRPQHGSVDSVKKIDFADLIDARQRFLTADNATVAVVGNFDRNLGFRAIRRYFGGWLKADRKVPSTFKQPEDPLAATQMIKSPRPNTAAVRFAVRGSARGDKNHAASLVFASVLESRLKARVPEAHSEDVFVKTHAHFLPGSIVIGFAAGKNEVGTGPGKVEAYELLSKAMSEPITEAEFLAAKRSVLAEWSKRDLGELWLDSDTYKLSNPPADLRAIEKVTISDVRVYAESSRRRPIASVVVAAQAGSE